MAGDGPISELPKNYEGEDTRPTTTREIWGWYFYGLAAEIYAVSGVGSFLPVTLEQLARDRGVLWSDPSKPCFQHGDNAPTNARSLLLKRFKHDGEQCMVQIFGLQVTTSSFAMYTFSLAVITQVVVLVSLSSFADYDNYRKRLLISFGMIGSVTSMLFIFMTPSILPLASILVIIGVACLGSSFAILNSFLPILVKNHPSVRFDRIKSVSEDDMTTSESDDYLPSSPTTPISPIATEHSDDAKTVVALSTSISSKGVGLGYLAAVSMQIFSICLLVFLKQILHVSSATLPLKLILFFVGASWMSFTILSSRYLQARPGPPFEQLHNLSATSSTLVKWLYYIGHAWSALYQTLVRAYHLRQMFIYLIAWFILSDAVATVSGTAILFARTTLKLSTIGIAMISITSTISGIIGAFGWPRIQRHFHLATNKTILGMIILLEGIPIYSLLPLFLPFMRSWSFGGLQAWWEIFPLACLYGFIMGGVSTYCRSFFSHLIPPGMEAAFFALFAVTDKGSSAIGPTVVGRIIDATGSIRPAFGFVAALVLAAAPLIWLVDVDQGRIDANQMARALSVKSDADGALAMSGSMHVIDGSRPEEAALLSAQQHG